MLSKHDGPVPMGESALCCAGTSGKVDVVIERIIVIYCVAHVFCICLYLTWIAIQNAIISPQPLSLSPISF